MSETSDLVNMVRSEGDGIFADRSLLEKGTIVSDERIVGREEQKRKLVEHLRPLMSSNNPPNILAYGQSGTGKSLITTRVLNVYQNELKNDRIDLAIIKINCQWLSTEHQAGIKIARKVEELDGINENITTSGIATHEVFNKCFTLLKENYDAVVFVVDEIDLLVDPNGSPESEAAYSSLLYMLTRIEDLVEFNRVSVIAITNYPDFMKDLDGRAESTFNPRNIAFPDYNATQLRKILKKRRDAFNDDVLTSEVIPIAAAIAAQNDGDARKAVDLLRSAGDEAVEQNDPEIREKHVRDAQQNVEQDRVMELASRSASSKQFVLLTAALIKKWSKTSVEEVPNPVLESVYNDIYEIADRKKKSKDTILRYMNEFETNGLVDSKRTSKGKGRGMYKRYTFNRSPGLIIDTLIEDTNFGKTISEDHSNAVKKCINMHINDFYNR